MPKGKENSLNYVEKDVNVHLENFIHSTTGLCMKFRAAPKMHKNFNAYRMGTGCPKVICPVCVATVEDLTAYYLDFTQSHRSAFKLVFETSFESF